MASFLSIICLALSIQTCIGQNANPYTGLFVAICKCIVFVNAVNGNMTLCFLEGAIPWV